MSFENNASSKVRFNVTLSIAIVSLLATFFSMKFDMPFPFPSPGPDADELVFTGGADESPPDDIVYIFALDVSSSYNSQKLCPKWYNDEKKKINDFIADSSSDFGNGSLEKPSLYELCKLKLAQLLLEFKDEGNKFEIWTTGRDANEKFSGKFEKNSIKRTIKSIAGLPENTDLNTNFVSFFDRLLSNHSYLDETTFNEFKLPKLVVPLEIWIKIIAICSSLFLGFAIMLYFLYSGIQFLRRSPRGLIDESAPKHKEVNTVKPTRKKKKTRKGFVKCIHSKCDEDSHPKVSNFCPKTGFPLLSPAKKFLRKYLYVIIALVLSLILFTIIIITGNTNKKDTKALSQKKAEFETLLLQHIQTLKTWKDAKEKEMQMIKEGAKAQIKASDAKFGGGR